MNGIILFALGVALNRHSVELHALVAESTHHHSNATDDLGQLSDFLRDFHSLTARALNAHYGRRENLWSPGSYDNVEIHDKPRLEEQLLYLWTNPVKDGLVEKPEDWPGVIFLPEDFGRTITVRRPEGAFFGGRRPTGWEPTFAPSREAARARARAREKDRREKEQREARPGARPPKERAPQPDRRCRRRLPETTTITIAVPPGYDDMPVEQVRAYFRRLLDEHVSRIHAERTTVGLIRFLGRPVVVAQDPLECAPDELPTFGRNPRLACTDPVRRVALLGELQAWRLAHRVAYSRWRAGDRNVEFPAGTYGMRRFHGARVAALTEPIEMG